MTHDTLFPVAQSIIIFKKQTFDFASDVISVISQWFITVQLSADPTRITEGPKDAVPKKGSTVHLACRIRYDRSLKLTVTWLKDDVPLYIGSRFVASSFP